MRASLCQKSIDCRLPVDALLVRPMRVQFVHFLIPLWRDRRMAIRDRCPALLIAVGNNANFHLIHCEPRRNDYVFDSAFFNIVGGEQPKSLLALGRGGCENDAFTLRPFRRMKKMRRPTGGPFSLSHRTE